MLSFQKRRVEQNINNNIQSYIFKNYYKETYGQTTINFDTNCIERIIKEYCLIDDIAKRKLLILYCHNENDAFGKKVCECWFQMEEIQTAISNPKVIVTGHNITIESQRNDLRAYMSSLIDNVETLTLIEFGKSKIYIMVPNENKMNMYTFIDEDHSKEQIMAELNDSILFHEKLNRIENFDEYYKSTFGETKINFNTTCIEEVIGKYCLIDDLSKRKILVLYCHNKNDEFGKVVCEEWFKNDAIQSTLSESRFIVAGYNIPDESRKIKFLEKESSFDLQISKIYIYVPIIGKMVSQAYIGFEEGTKNDFLAQLIDIKVLFGNVIKPVRQEIKQSATEQTCESFQQLIFDNMEDKDFDIFSTNEHRYLKEKIGFAYFGPPSSKDGYNEKQNQFIKKAFHVILTQSDKYANADGVVVISIIFACCVNFVKINDNLCTKKDQFNPVPIFILRKCKPCSSSDHQTGNFCRIVIDSNFRVYTSWEKFLKENKYPNGKRLYVPKNGEYQSNDDGSLDCTYHYTPACGDEETFLRGLDHTSAIAGIGSGGLLLIAAIPAITIAPIAITGAIVAGIGAGIYSIGRSVGNLIDRGAHDEDLSFSEAESRAAYIGIVAGALGFAGAGANVALAQFAKNGTNIGKMTITSVNVLSKANLVSGSVALGNSVYDVTRSYFVDGEEPSTLTLVQLGASALFFGNSVYNYRNASTIVSEAQNNTIKKMNEDMRSNRHRKMFNKLQKETARVNNGNKAAANAKVISTIRNANNVDETMAILTRNNKRFNKLGIKFSADNRQISFNGQNMNVLNFAGAVNEVHISEVMSLPPGTMASSSFKSSFDISWVELGLDLTNIARNRLLDPSTVQFTRELLNIFALYIQKKIVSLMNKVWPTFSENSKELGLTKHYIISTIIDYICEQARTLLNLGSLGSGCVDVIKLLVNFYFCGKTITDTVVEGCSVFITLTISKKIASEEQIKLEQMEKEKKMENKRELVKCLSCSGYYNQKQQR